MWPNSRQNKMLPVYISVNHGYVSNTNISYMYHRFQQYVLWPLFSEKCICNHWILLRRHRVIFLPCLWQPNWIPSWDVETSAKPDTTGRDGVFTFLSVKPLDSFKMTTDHFPAVLATTRLDILVRCQQSCQARHRCSRWRSNICKCETTG